MCRVLDNSLFVKDRKKYIKISEMSVGLEIFLEIVRIKNEGCSRCL